MTTFDFHQQQVATSERSAAMRLDPETEERLYRLYREFFQHAEEERQWNPWTSIPWEGVVVPADDDLIAAVLRTYREDLFLPDYSSEALKALRASRGRAWFLTRWSYEEGKHLLALGEWLTRVGAYTDDELKALSDELLTLYRWQPPADDAPAIFVDMLLWEAAQLERKQELWHRAEVTGDVALVAIAEKMLADDRAHRDFFRSALQRIAEPYPGVVADAVQRVTTALDVSTEQVAELLA